MTGNVALTDKAGILTAPSYAGPIIIGGDIRLQDNTCSQEPAGSNLLLYMYEDQQNYALQMGEMKDSACVKFLSGRLPGEKETVLIAVPYDGHVITKEDVAKLKYEDPDYSVAVFEDGNVYLARTQDLPFFFPEDYADQDDTDSGKEDGEGGGTGGGAGSGNGTGTGADSGAGTDADADAAGGEDDQTAPSELPATVDATGLIAKSFMTVAAIFAAVALIAARGLARPAGGK